MKVTDGDLEELIKENIKDIKLIAQKYYLSGGGEEDLLQEGLIGFIDGVNSYNEARGDTSSLNFKKFTLMCAKRQILDAIKKANSKRNLPLNSSVSINTDSYLEADETYDIAQTPEELVIKKDEAKEQLFSIEIKLSEFEKQVLDLYLEGLKQSAIAQKLGKSNKSIDNTLQRIKNKLRG
ncbi:MAG: sigma-70 family RNA polymerase sigma factor [Christensenellales bacterium]